MTRRCYSDEPIASSTATLSGSEAHHLLHVLRAAPGMPVTLFDGSGAEFDAEVTACKRSTVELRVLRRREVNRDLPLPLTLGVPLPKGDRQRWIVEKAAELGVTRLVPLVTHRSVVAGEKHLPEKLRRYVIEASKQCGRNRLMQIAAPLGWSPWLELPQTGGEQQAHADVRKWIAHPGGRPIAVGEMGLLQPAFIAVGPEGGLTDEEIDAAKTAGWEIVDLGPRILRIETAALALASLVAFPSPALS
ncbi:MAG: 16S rRNA (uracil(1498)-N(3))-methyltransferase [Pirellulales bacterium]|nr:16S rRNA (uracil(1498)-N(3))-methyltransferase [Pirellulales bacterium]